jgi:hypothetical protein
MTDTKRPRGRPTKDTIGDTLLPNTPMWYAMKVFTKQEESSFKRMHAVDAVIKELGPTIVDRDTLKRYASRHADELFEIASGQVARAAERDRSKHLMEARMAHGARIKDFLFWFPQDVKERMGSLPLVPTIRLLEKHLQLGDSPSWLVDCIRCNPSACGRELLALLKTAAPAI